MTARCVLRLTKHHGLGNDFLVLLEPVPGLDAAALARRVCDRRRGVGADGLLMAHPARTVPTSRWSCATPTAAAPR